MYCHQFSVNLFVVTIFLFLISPVAKASALNDGLVLHAPFQELQEEKLLMYGEGNPKANITPKHVDLVSGVKDKGISFAGVEDQAVELYGNALQKITEELTVSIWVKPDEPTGTSGGTIIDRNWSWQVRLHGNRPHLHFLGDPHQKNKVTIQSDDMIPSYEWTNIIYTFSYKGRQVALYINGEKKGEEHIDFKMRDEGENPLLIGISPNNYHPYSGAVDELKVYNKALSPQQIKELYSHEGETLFRSASKKWNDELRNKEQKVFSSNAEAVKENFRLAMEAIANLKKDSSSDKYEKAELAVTQFNDTLTYYEVKSKAGKQGVKDMAVFVVQPYRHNRILPKTQVDPSNLSETITLRGSPSEMLTGSFVLRPTKKNVQALNVIPSAIKSEDDETTISDTAIDVRIVKTWFQAGIGLKSPKFNSKDIDRMERILTPELLLHDASLVKVDYDKKKQYLKLNEPGGYNYVNISERKTPGISDETYKENRIDIVADEFPVADDADHLQPIDIDKDFNQQFWLNIKLPDDAKPGRYKGKLSIISASGIEGEINLQVEVLPIKLDPPKTYYDLDKRFYYGVYYSGSISDDGKAYIGNSKKSKTQLRAELENLRAHELDFSQMSASDPEGLAMYAEIMGGKKFFRRGGNNLYMYTKSSDKDLDRLESRAKKIIADIRKHGYEDIYIYGIDEAPASVVKKELKLWERLHGLGIKIYVAVNQKDVARRFGKELDVLVSARRLSPARVDRMHKYDNSIFSYNNPQAGMEDPKLYRVNYGIKLWKHNYDGAMNWIYQGGYGIIWNDFDSHHATYRDQVFTYPTTNGVIDTIQWEGYAQAKRDVKYASHLWKMISEYQNSGDNSKKDIAKKAERYINGLEINMDTDLEEVRNKIIDFILQLSQ